MDLLELKRKLISAARCNPPGEQVPYAFEKRIMACLDAIPKPDEWLWWGRALWRGAAACAGIALLLSAWSLWPGPGQKAAGANGGVDLEEEVLASVNEADVNW